MSQANSPAAERELPPLHMRREAFDPTPELREIREKLGVQVVTNAFGMRAVSYTHLTLPTTPYV